MNFHIFQNWGCIIFLVMVSDINIKDLKWLGIDNEEILLGSSTLGRMGKSRLRITNMMDVQTKPKSMIVIAC